MTPAAFRSLFRIERARFAAAFPRSQVGAARLYLTSAPCPFRVDCAPVE